MKKFLAALTTLLLVLAPYSPVFALSATDFEASRIVDVDANAEVGINAAYAPAINNQGYIVGNYIENMNSAQPRPFLKVGNNFTTLAVPAGYTRAVVEDINDNGVIIGRADNYPSSSTQALKWVDGIPELLPYPEGGYGCLASAVNNPGDIVGTCHVPNPAVNGGVAIVNVLWRGNEVINIPRIGAPPAPVGITDAGAVVMGSDYYTHTGYIWQNGTITYLQKPTGATSCTQQAVSGSGLIAGMCGFTGAGGRAVLWDNGTIRVMPDVPGYDSSGVQGVNDRGDIVGEADKDGMDENISHAVAWIDGEPVDLGGSRYINDVEGTSEESGLARDINNNGLIVGQSTIANQGYLPLLWTPRPNKPTGLTSASPVQSANLTWNPVAGSDHYDIYRDNVKIGFSASASYSDTTNPTEGSHVYEVATVNAGGSASSKSDPVTVVIDRTAPTLSGLSWTTNPLQQGSSTTLSVTANDSLSGLSSVEYSIDGNAPQAMTYNATSGKWEVSFGQNLSANTYGISVTATDLAANTSSVQSDILAVYNAANGYVAGHEKLLPSATDTMPIARDSSSNPAELIVGFSNVKAATSTSAATGSFDLQYTIKNKKDEFTLSSKSIDWVVVTDATHASILGRADLTKYVGGVKTVVTDVSVRIDLVLGANGSPDHVSVKIYDPAVNPATGTPSYVISDFATATGSKAQIKP